MWVESRGVNHAGPLDLVQETVIEGPGGQFSLRISDLLENDPNSSDFRLLEVGVHCVR